MRVLFDQGTPAPLAQALAPLDAALGDLRMNWKGMLFFVIAGIAFLLIAFISEIRRQNDT